MDKRIWEDWKGKCVGKHTTEIVILISGHICFQYGFESGVKSQIWLFFEVSLSEEWKKLFKDAKLIWNEMMRNFKEMS